MKYIFGALEHIHNLSVMNYEAHVESSERFKDIHARFNKLDGNQGV